MKRVFDKVFIFVNIFSIFLAFQNTYAENKTTNNETLIFAILSDVHINENDKSKSDKLNNALSIINKREPTIDKYIFTGDYTNSGFIEEYNLFNDIYFKSVLNEDKRIMLMGNHDYWNELKIEESKERFKKELKQNLYGFEKIKGYTFISISSENDSIHGYYSKESIELAKIDIEKSIDENANKPIFIFTHHPPKDTIYGSDIWGNSDLKNVFDNYPQVILFAGHSHFPTNDERGIYQESYSVVTAGGIGGMELEEGKIDGSIPKDSSNFSQGLIVKIDEDNKVIITKIDFSNNEEIKSPWIIDNFNKESFKYKSERKNNKSPYFPLYSTAKIVSRKGEEVNIIFTQGRDDDMVHSYKVELYERRIEDIIKIEEMLMFSKFYLGISMPKELDFILKKIDKNKEYIVKIYAIDSFDNISYEPLICEINKM